MAYNRRSKNITQGVARSPNRSMYYALGYQKEDFDKPMVGIANGHQGVRRESADFRHADHFRRHVDGHRRHEVLARLA
jgi:dihydroxyacid dehydratase/phosphogluconate dehydratase